MNERSNSTDTDALIRRFCLDTTTSTALLWDRHLYGQFLVLMYSAIDSMGLLDAPSTQTSASGDSFKAWVTKYLLPYGQFDFNEVDFWAARCSVLHSFTSSSDLSSKGKAREIQYFSGERESSQMHTLFQATRQIDNGGHVPAHLQDTYRAFLAGVQSFELALSTNCRTDKVYAQRLQKVLQRFVL